jgi:hypothetical protein
VIGTHKLLLVALIVTVVPAVQVLLTGGAVTSIDFGMLLNPAASGA